MKEASFLFLLPVAVVSLVPSTRHVLHHYGCLPDNSISCQQPFPSSSLCYLYCAHDFMSG